MFDEAKALKGRNFIKHYTFQYKNEPIKRVLPLVMAEHYTVAEAARIAGVTKSAAERFLRINRSNIKLNIKDVKSDMDSFYLEQFLKEPWIHDEYEYNVYGLLFPYFPSFNNITIYKTVKDSFPEVFTLIDSIFEKRTFIPVDELADNPMFPDAASKLRLLLTLFSATERYVIFPVDGIFCLSRFDEENIAQIVFYSFTTPMSYSGFVDNRLKLLRHNSKILSLRGAPRDLTKYHFVYRLDHDLFGIAENLSYPNKIKDILSTVSDALTNVNGGMNIDMLYERVKEKFPRLISVYELISIFKHDSRVIVNGSSAALAESRVQDALNELKKQQKLILRYTTKLINSKKKIFPETTRAYVIAYLKVLRPEMVISVLHTYPLMELQTDEGIPFIINMKWSKAKTMFCIAFNFNGPVELLKMQKLLRTAGKNLKDADLNSSFTFNGMTLTYSDGNFLISKIVPCNHNNYLNI